MSNIDQLTRKVQPVCAISVYNGTGADIEEGICCAFDSTNPPTSTQAAGIKITTGDSDYVGITSGLLKAGATGSLQVGGIGLGTAGDDIVFGSTLSLMSDSNGELIPRTSGKRSAGIPLHTAASGDPIQFLIRAGDAS